MMKYFYGRDCFVPRNDDRAGKKLLGIINSIPVVLLFVLVFFTNVIAQKTPEKSWNSSRILHEIEKVKHVGRVLYVAAHPDDENTQLISYLVNVKGIETTYMSLTRGDGGQDLLGPEVRDELGVIRTQELLMARATDGGQQFFSRANDFGFSKTAKETLHIWDSTEVLSDIVWEIRRFKPDIIIIRFSPTYTKTHGHHQASAILTQRAFDDAANPAKFPEQLKYVSTWQAKSLFWNTSTFFFTDNKFDTTGLYNTNIGSYIPLLGKSIGEMAAESRSMHKSQGMGSSPRRGDNMEYFISMKGEKPAGKDIFNDYNWDWNRINGCETITADIDKIISSLDMVHPDKSVDGLITLHKKLEPFRDNYLVQSKLQQIDDIILQCEGIYAEAISTKEFLPVGDSINAGLNIIVQNPATVKIASASLEISGRKVASFASDAMLTPNATKTFTAGALIPDTTSISGPYWLEEDPTVGMYKVDNQLMRGLPQNPQQVVADVIYSIGDGINSITIEKDLPVFSKTRDPLKGDVYSLARIVPPAVVIPQGKLLVFANDKPKEIYLKVKSFKKGKAYIVINTPKDWSTVLDSNTYPTDMHLSDSIGIYMNGNGTEQIVDAFVCPMSPSYYGTGNIDIYIDMNGHSYNRSFEDINYDHIPEQMLLPKSKVKVVRMDIKTHLKLIGYINGAGDDIPAALKEMGYKVEIIPSDQLATANLSKYDAIIAGVRAYNTVERLKYDNAKLMDYVKNGGNYIVQYNTLAGLVTDSIGPYYLHPSNTRTTEEDCKITFLNTDNPALNTPNKITQKDFDGWVQERGLYYPDKWDTAHYVPLLEMNDTGEPPTKGALLVAHYGKGNFVYTGLVFFRELPAGVPGAYRLMANLIELEKH
jgi:LmbE family N-acetylglucosaminyl deacetylase